MKRFFITKKKKRAFIISFICLDIVIAIVVTLCICLYNNRPVKYKCYLPEEYSMEVLVEDNFNPSYMYRTQIETFKKKTTFLGEEDVVRYYKFTNTTYDKDTNEKTNSYVEEYIYADKQLAKDNKPLIYVEEDGEYKVATSTVSVEEDFISYALRANNVPYKKNSINKNNKSYIEINEYTKGGKSGQSTNYQTLLTMDSYHICSLYYCYTVLPSEEKHHFVTFTSIEYQARNKQIPHLT